MEEIRTAIEGIVLLLVGSSFVFRRRLLRRIVRRVLLEMAGALIEENTAPDPQPQPLGRIPEAGRTTITLGLMTRFDTKLDRINDQVTELTAKLAGLPDRNETKEMIDHHRVECGRKALGSIG